MRKMDVMMPPSYQMEEEFPVSLMCDQGLVTGATARLLGLLVEESMCGR